MNNQLESGRICLKGLRCLAKLGVLPEEKVAPQEIIIDVVLQVDFSEACHSDRLSDTVDYVMITSTIKDICLASHTELCECLMQKLATRLFEYPKLLKIEISIEKPTILPNTRSVGTSGIFSRVI